jgi:hypothetical protein
MFVLIISIFPRSFYFTEYKILTAQSNSPLWEQGKRDMKDVITCENGATLLEFVTDPNVTYYYNHKLFVMGKMKNMDLIPSSHT